MGNCCSCAVGWLPSFGIIGKRVGRGGGEGTERGPFKPCEIVVSVVRMIFIPFPPFWTLSSSSQCFSPPPSPSLPIPPPCSMSFHAWDQTTILRWASSTDCWISHSLCASSLACLPKQDRTPPTHTCARTHKHTTARCGKRSFCCCRSLANRLCLTYAWVHLLGTARYHLLLWLLKSTSLTLGEIFLKRDGWELLTPHSCLSIKATASISGSLA